jgi:hypothetical protein
MPARYVARHSAAAQPGFNKPLLLLGTGSEVCRAWIYEIRLSSEVTPDDKTGIFEVVRFTGTLAATDLAETRVDPAEGVSNMSARGATITGFTRTPNTVLLSFPLHQRATFRWLAKPGGQIVVPRIIDNWVGVGCVDHGATPSISVNMGWEE